MVPLGIFLSLLYKLDLVLLKFAVLLVLLEDLLLQEVQVGSILVLLNLL